MRPSPILTATLALCLVLAGCSGLQAGSPTATVPSPTEPTEPTEPRPAPTTATPTPTPTRPSPAIVAENFDPAYDLSAVLRRVERLRGLSTTERIAVVEGDLATRRPDGGTLEPGTRFDFTDDGVRFGIPAATALQLYSTEPATYRGHAAMGTAGASRVFVGNGTALLNWTGFAGETVLAHELTHALQDQRGLAEPPRYRGTTDGFFAANALMEGDATLVAQTYWEEYEPGGVEPLVARNQTRPRARWRLGLSDSVRRGGARYYRRTDPSPRARNRALRNPPATTADLLHPGTEASLPGASLPVPEPSGLDPTARDRVGELVIRHVLRTNGIPHGRAADAAAGWRNDTLVSYRHDGPTAVYWGTRWANGTEARTFAATWRTMLRNLNATTDGDVVTVPGTDAYPTMHYVISRDGPVVAVAAAERRAEARRIAS